MNNVCLGSNVYNANGQCKTMSTNRIKKRKKKNPPKHFEYLAVVKDGRQKGCFLKWYSSIRVQYSSTRVIVVLAYKYIICLLSRVGELFSIRVPRGFFFFFFSSSSSSYRSHLWRRALENLRRGLCGRRAGDRPHGQRKHENKIKCQVKEHVGSIGTHSIPTYQTYLRMYLPVRPVSVRA